MPFARFLAVVPCLGGASGLVGRLGSRNQVEGVAIEKPSPSKLRIRPESLFRHTPTLAFKAQHHAHSLVEHGRGSVSCSKVPALHLRHAVLQAPDL